MKSYTYLFVIIICSLTSCEPDDICLEGISGTPNLIVVFYDSAQPENKKEVSNLKITGVGVETALHSGSTDSIAIPLKLNQKKLHKKSFEQLTLMHLKKHI